MIINNARPTLLLPPKGNNYPLRTAKTNSFICSRQGSRRINVIAQIDLFTGDNIRTALAAATFLGGPAFFLNQSNTKFEKSRSDLKEQSAKSDTKFEKMQEKSDANFKEMRSDLKEQSAKSDVKFDKMMSEIKEQSAKSDAKFEKMQEKSDAKFEKMSNELKEQSAKSDAKFEKMHEKLTELNYQVLFFKNAINLSRPNDFGLESQKEVK